MPDQVPLDAVIDGVVDHLLHVSFDERTVLRLTATTGGEESITALGKALFGVRPGESLRLHGAWVHHPRHGRQFRAERCERTVACEARLLTVSWPVLSAGWPQCETRCADGLRQVFRGEP